VASPVAIRVAARRACVHARQCERPEPPSIAQRFCFPGQPPGSAELAISEEV
jgi:hypothetical protein